MTDFVGRESAVKRAFDLATEFGVDLTPDIRRVGETIPHLARLSNHGALVHVTAAGGADFYKAQINYFRDHYQIAASRVIEIIMPGFHSDLTYYPRKAEPLELSVHQGAGHLIISDPADETFGKANSLNTKFYPINAEVTPSITLQPGQFYTIEADKWSGPLVISGLCQFDPNGQWRPQEVPVELGSTVIDTPDGFIEVPDDFANAEFN